MANFCKYCGAPLKENYKFCMKCGKQIETVANVEPQKADEETLIIQKNEKLISDVEVIVKRINAGDASAFEELFEATKQYLYFNIVSITSQASKSDIEDIMQEIYISIYMNIGKLEQPRAALKWIKTIARNKTYDFYKKSSVKNENLIKEEQEYIFEGEDELRQPIPIPEDILDNRETQQIVMNTLDELPEDQRKIITAYYFNESKVGEIAELLDMPEGTVKTKLYRARTALKEKFEQLEKEQGIRLHSVGILPFMLCLLYARAETAEIPGELNASIKTKVFSSDLLRHLMSRPGVSVSQSVQVNQPVQSNMAAQANQMVQSNQAAQLNQAIQPASAAAQAAGKAAGAGVAKAITTKVVVGVVVGAAAVGGIGTVVYKKANASTPEKTLYQFMDSYNAGNLDDMMACCDEDTRRTYGKVNGVLKGFLGIGTQDIIDVALGFTDEELETIVVQSSEVDYWDKEHAEVSYTAICYDMDGTTESMSDTVELVKEGSTWRIDLSNYSMW